MLPPTKNTVFLCGARLTNPIILSHRKKMRWTCLLISGGILISMMILCVCVFGEWLWGGKKLFGTWGLSYWKPVLGVLSNMDFAEDRDLTWRLLQLGKHLEFQVGQILQQSLIAKLNIYEYLILLYFLPTNKLHSNFSKNLISWIIQTASCQCLRRLYNYVSSLSPQLLYTFILDLKLLQRS